MIICDRCHSPAEVEHFTVETYAGDRPNLGMYAEQCDLDLCAKCRKAVQSLIEREMTRKRLE